MIWAPFFFLGVATNLGIGFVVCVSFAIDFGVASRSGFTTILGVVLCIDVVDSLGIGVRDDLGIATYFWCHGQFWYLDLSF